MTSNEISYSAHEIQRLESTIKFLYLLRDLGIDSARERLAERWHHYMVIISALTVEGQ